MNQTLFLSRKHYDQVLTTNGALLKKAVAECKKDRAFGNAAYSWSVSGITFTALSPETAAAIKAVIS